MTKRKSNGEGTIYFRKDRQQYCGQIVTGINPKTGKLIRKTVYGKTRSEVIKKKKALESQLITGTYRGPTDYTVESWLNHWVENNVKNRLSAKSYEMYKYIIRVHLIPALGTVKLEDVTTEMIENLLNKKMNPADGSRKLKMRTVYYIKQTLNAAMKKAKRNKLISYNMVEDVDLPAIPKPRPTEKAMTTEEMTTFIRGTQESPYHTIWEIGFLTGFRRGELLGLKWTDIDFKASVINLRRQVVLIDSKPVVTDDLKTTGSAQEIVVLPIAIDKLRQHKLKQRELFLKLGIQLDEDDLVFTNYTKNPMRPDVISHAFTRERKRLGLREGLSMHGTRHTFATLSAESGMETMKLKDLMRHADISTTMGYVGTMKSDSYRAELTKLSTVVAAAFDEEVKVK
jgi:integrase